MTDFKWMTVAQAHAGLKAGDFTAEALVKASLAKIEETKDLNCYISMTGEFALEQARAVDAKIAAGEDIEPLAGIPGSLKDLFNMKGTLTTSGGLMLGNYRSPYDATVVTKLKGVDAAIVGKNNMDECACGVSNETSYYGPVLNPWNKEYVPGGSSGGSVASVASGQVMYALGTDTGGSIRQPAALCGVVGFKPTYGRVSRFGANAMASSWDHVGPITRTVEDAALVMNVIAGHDEYDATTPDIEVPDYTADLGKSMKGLKIGVPKEFFVDGVDEEVKVLVNAAIKKYEEMGAIVKEVSLPMTKYGVAVYYVTTPGELSTNLARIDGVRFGHKPEGDFPDINEYYKAARGEGFGDEIKRRIMVGTFVLSAGYADAYYKQAQRVRTLVIREFEAAFKEVDVLMAPTSPIAGFKIGEKFNDPLAMYALDLLTIPADAAGIPAISIPCG
ncbi:MAG: aspartyl-tRNA(Asn)/glutamyl-tRNA(Gln) amidotransferase subunit A, partial [Oceanicoccus sp.]